MSRCLNVVSEADQAVSKLAVERKAGVFIKRTEGALGALLSLGLRRLRRFPGLLPGGQPGGVPDRAAKCHDGAVIAGIIGLAARCLLDWAAGPRDPQGQCATAQRAAGAGMAKEQRL